MFPAIRIKILIVIFLAQNTISASVNIAQTSQQADYFRSFYQTLPCYTLEITEDLFAGIFFHLII